MPEPLLKDTIELDVDGIHYIFTIPDLRGEIKLGLRERQIRRDLETELLGSNYGATGEPTGDSGTDFLVQTAAMFELLLRKCSSEWPYSNDEAGKPVVDYTKWPIDKLTAATTTAMRLRTELSRFRQGGTGDNKPAGGEVVAGQSDTGHQPV